MKYPILLPNIFNHSFTFKSAKTLFETSLIQLNLENL